MPVYIYWFSTSGYSFSKLTSIFCLGSTTAKFIYVRINSNLFLITIPPLTVFIISFFNLNFALYKHLSEILDSVISLQLINPLNAQLNPICHLLALLGAHHIFHVSGVRVNFFYAIYLVFLCLHACSFFYHIFTAMF
jgi:hypothetical protein